MRVLLSRGWELVNDLQWPDRGNIDHVLIGPAGVFVLETKSLSGRVSVTDGRVSVRHVEAPDDERRIPQDAGAQARANAAALCRELRTAGIDVSWVHSVVVLWASFEQRKVEAGQTVWVHGSRLVDHLSALPRRLDPDTIAQIRVLFEEGP